MHLWTPTDAFVTHIDTRSSPEQLETYTHGAVPNHRQLISETQPGPAGRRTAHSPKLRPQMFTASRRISPHCAKIYSDLQIITLVFGLYVWIAPLVRQKKFHFDLRSAP